MRAPPYRSMPPAGRAWPRTCASSPRRRPLPWPNRFAPARRPAAGAPLHGPPPERAGRPAIWLLRWWAGSALCASSSRPFSRCGWGSRRRCCWWGRPASAKRGWPASLWPGPAPRAPRCSAGTPWRWGDGCPISHWSRRCASGWRRKTRLLPELRVRYPDLPVPTEDKLAARGQLFEAVVRLCDALARRAPLVLLLEDLHWVDGASLDLLRYLGHSWKEHGNRV